MNTKKQTQKILVRGGAGVEEAKGKRVYLICGEEGYALDVVIAYDIEEEYDMNALYEEGEFVIELGERVLRELKEVEI